MTLVRILSGGASYHDQAGHYRSAWRGEEVNMPHDRARFLVDVGSAVFLIEDVAASEASDPAVVARMAPEAEGFTSYSSEGVPSRGGPVVGRRSHTPEREGSIPSPAIGDGRPRIPARRPRKNKGR